MAAIANGAVQIVYSDGLEEETEARSSDPDYFLQDNSYGVVRRGITFPDAFQEFVEEATIRNIPRNKAELSVTFDPLLISIDKTKTVNIFDKPTLVSDKDDAILKNISEDDTSTTGKRADVYTKYSNNIDNLLNQLETQYN